MSIDTFCENIFGDKLNHIRNSINKEDYVSIKIPKKEGFRNIEYLNENSTLNVLQTKLKSRIFDKQILPLCVKGFVKGESYYSYLQPHIDSDYYLRVDISDFFGSIDKKMIENTMSELLNDNIENDINEICELIADITTLNGKLPQGACTSPSISNLVMRRIDQRILKYCQSFNVRYTRYADDLLFSCKKSLGYKMINFKVDKWFLKKIKLILSSSRFKINHSKLKYGVSYISLNGYVVSNEGVSLSRKRLSDIMKVLYYNNLNIKLAKSNLSEFLCGLNKLDFKYRDLTKYPFDSIFQYIQFLSGYRAFLISLVNNDYKKTNFQKKNRKIILKIENFIDVFYSIAL